MRSKPSLHAHAPVEDLTTEESSRWPNAERLPSVESAHVSPKLGGEFLLRQKIFENRLRERHGDHLHAASRLKIVMRDRQNRREFGENRRAIPPLSRLTILLLRPFFTQRILDRINNAVVYVAVCNLCGRSPARPEIALQIGQTAPCRLPASAQCSVDKRPLTQ